MRTEAIVGITVLVAVAFPFLAVWAGRRLHPAPDPVLAVSRAHRLSVPESFTVDNALEKGEVLLDARLRAAVVALGRLRLEQAERERRQLLRWRPWLVTLGLLAVGWTGWRVGHGDVEGLIPFAQWAAILGLSLRSSRNRRRRLDGAVRRNTGPPPA